MSDSGQATLYDKDGIRVTAGAVCVRAREFPLAEVVSAHLSSHRADMRGLRIRALVGAAVSGAGLIVLLTGGQAGALAAVLGALVVLFTIHRMRTRRPIYRLRLETAEGDIQVAADTDEAEMEALLGAVRGAIQGRGQPSEPSAE